MKNKTLAIVLGLILFAGMQSCFHQHNHDIYVSIEDDDYEYEMEAAYNKRKAGKVRDYLNNNLLNGNFEIRRNSLVEKEITLDDNTTFYLNSMPGSLHIKIDKTENTDEALERIRIACEELKEILADN